jgi:hypothetical protein
VWCSRRLGVKVSGESGVWMGIGRAGGAGTGGRERSCFLRLSVLFLWKGGETYSWDSGFHHRDMSNVIPSPIAGRISSF